MKLVQTLVVRDEVDIVADQITYHLNSGVDFVIASDHQSTDGTTEILERYERDGHLRRIEVRGEMHDGLWRTSMARLAATEHDADWVINTDADEFWMPRQGTLKEVFAAIPETHGVVYALSRHFVPRPDDDARFADRMTSRVSPAVAINDPTSPYRPHLKAAHRSDPEITVGHGSHTAFSPSLRVLHHWHPADVLHFPFRSLRQWENKGVRRARGDSQLGQYVAALLASEQGRSAERYAALVVDDEELRRGLENGSLQEDVRLRAALSAGRTDGRAQPGPAYDTSYLSDSVSVRDADIVRLRRHLDRITVRVGALEDE
jgi:glycosyltransferase involved in cell wall biosynthesis